MRDSIPHKSPAPPDFYTTASGQVSGTSFAVQTRGGYRKKFPWELFRYLRGTESPLEEGVLLLHFFHNKALNDIAFLDIIVVLDAHAALIRGCNFLHIVLEALEGIQVTLMEYDAVTTTRTSALR